MRYSWWAKMVTWFQPHQSDFSGRLKASKESRSRLHLQATAAKAWRQPAPDFSPPLAWFLCSCKTNDLRKRNANEAHFHQMLAGWTGSVWWFDSTGYMALMGGCRDCEYVIMTFLCSCKVLALCFRLLLSASAILHIIFGAIKGHFCSNYCIYITLSWHNKTPNWAKWLEKNVHLNVAARSDVYCVCLLYPCLSHLFFLTWGQDGSFWVSVM